MIRKLGMIKFCYQEKELESPKDKVKSLRLWISTDPELSASLNCNEKLEKVRNPGCWKYLEVCWKTYIARENHCYQITGGLPISLSTLASSLKLQGFKRNK